MDWKIYNMFYVSLLRKYVSNPTHVFSELLNAAIENKLLAAHERILKVDIQHLKNRSFQIFLVK